MVFSFRRVFWLSLLFIALACSSQPAEPPKALPTLDVLVDGRPLPQYSVDGVAFVEGRIGARFAVRVSLPGERFLAVVMVEGINTYDRSRSEDDGLVSRDQQIRRGFRVNRSEVEAFEFTAPEESLAAEMGDPSQLGRIRALVYLESPDAQKHYFHRNLGRRSNLGTGEGGRISSPIGIGTPFVRKPGPPLAVLEVRYDDGAGLCQRGLTDFCIQPL